MNIYKQELINFRFQTILWTVILSGVCILCSAVYPVLYSNKDVFLSILSKFPPEVVTGLGFDIDTMFSALGYYCFILTYILLIGAFQGAIIGIKVIRNDQNENAESFILTKPISRKNILRAKTLAALTCLFITNVIIQLLSVVMMFLVSKESFNVLRMIMINLGLLLVQVTFASIAMVVGAFTKKKKTTNLIAVVIIFAFYVLHMVEDILDAKFLKYINPFSYFDPNDILTSGNYSWTFMIASVVIMLFCINFSFIHYENSDIIKE